MLADVLLIFGRQPRDLLRRGDRITLRRGRADAASSRRRSSRFNASALRGERDLNLIYRMTTPRTFNVDGKVTLTFEPVGGVSASSKGSRADRPGFNLPAENDIGDRNRRICGVTGDTSSA